MPIWLKVCVTPQISVYEWICGECVLQGYRRTMLMGQSESPKQQQQQQKANIHRFCQPICVSLSYFYLE